MFLQYFQWFSYFPHLDILPKWKHLSEVTHSYRDIAQQGETDFYYEFQKRLIGNYTAITKPLCWWTRITLWHNTGLLLLVCVNASIMCLAAFIVLWTSYKVWFDSDKQKSIFKRKAGKSCKCSRHKIYTYIK